MHVGLAMTQIELEKIADSFDKDRSGMIDLSAILGVLKGRTQRRPRPLSQETLTDDDKIENEVMKATFCILKTITLCSTGKSSSYPTLCRFCARFLSAHALRSS